MAAVTPGTVFRSLDPGTPGRNSFRAPGNWNLDAALHKRFRLTEDASLQFRAELFNLLNHSNLFVPGSAIGINSTSFVQASFSGRRQLQLAVKLLFSQQSYCG